MYGSNRHLYSLSSFCVYERTHFVSTWTLTCILSGNIRVDLLGTVYLKQARILIMSIKVSRHRPDQLQLFVNVLMHPCFPLSMHVTETVQSHQLKETAWVASPNTHTRVPTLLQVWRNQETFRICSNCLPFFFFHGKGSSEVSTYFPPVFRQAMTSI